MQMEDRSWKYESGDVLAHFKGVLIFLEATPNMLHVGNKRQYIVLVKYVTTT
jgi:hypothetical protein